MDIVHSLMCAGLTRHESLLYIGLCREGNMTGYEASKVSGIPRSNAYLALAGLTEKGAVRKIEGDPVRYEAVPPDEFTKNLEREYHEHLRVIRTGVPVPAEDPGAFVTLAGSRAVVHKMKNMLENSTKRIYLSMTTEVLRLLDDEITSAVSRGLKVVVITTSGWEKPAVTVYRNDKPPGQIRLIADSAEVLTGQFCESGEANCLYSRNRNMVELIKDSLKNEITLIDLKRI